MDMTPELRLVHLARNSMNNPPRMSWVPVSIKLIVRTPWSTAGTTFFEVLLLSASAASHAI